MFDHLDGTDLRRSLCALVSFPLPLLALLVVVRAVILANTPRNNEVPSRQRRRWSPPQQRLLPAGERLDPWTTRSSVISRQP